MSVAVVVIRTTRRGRDKGVAGQRRQTACPAVSPRTLLRFTEAARSVAPWGPRQPAARLWSRFQAPCTPSSPAGWLSIRPTTALWGRGLVPVHRSRPISLARENLAPPPSSGLRCALRHRITKGALGRPPDVCHFNVCFEEPFALGNTHGIRILFCWFIKRPRVMITFPHETFKFLNCEKM